MSVKKYSIKVAFLHKMNQKSIICHKFHITVFIFISMLIDSKHIY